MNLTCGGSGTNVRVAISRGAIRTLSNAFEVQLSPALELNPTSFVLRLAAGQTTTRTFTLRNAGGGSLTWAFGAAAAMSELSAGVADPVAPSPTQKKRDCVATVDAAAIIVAVPRVPESSLADLAPPDLLTILANFNANSSVIRSTIPIPFSFTDGVSLPVTLEVTSEPSLSVNPGVAWTPDGPRGGPFTNATQEYTLTNPGLAPTAWSLQKSAPWLDVSSGGGNLAAGGPTKVTASLNAAAATLAPQTYTDALVFTSLTNGVGTTTRSVTLTVQPFGVLEASPGGNWSGTGPFGGPFSPASRSYT